MEKSCWRRLTSFRRERREKIQRERQFSESNRSFQRFSSLVLARFVLNIASTGQCSTFKLLRQIISPIRHRIVSLSSSTLFRKRQNLSPNSLLHSFPASLRTLYLLLSRMRTGRRRMPPTARRITPLYLDSFN